MKYIIASIEDLDGEIQSYVVFNFVDGEKQITEILTLKEIQAEAINNIAKTKFTGYGNIRVNPDGSIKIIGKKLVPLVKSGKSHILKSKNKSMTVYIEGKFARAVRLIVSDATKVNCICYILDTDRMLKYVKDIINIRGGKSPRIIGNIERLEPGAFPQRDSINSSLALLGVKGVYVDNFRTAIISNECARDIIIPDGVVSVVVAGTCRIDNVILPKSVKNIWGNYGRGRVFCSP